MVKQGWAVCMPGGHASHVKSSSKYPLAMNLACEGVHMNIWQPVEIWAGAADSVSCDSSSQRRLDIRLDEVAQSSVATLAGQKYTLPSQTGQVQKVGWQPLSLVALLAEVQSPLIT